MAWDPTQGQEQPGNGEPEQPPNGGSEPNPANSAPQNPYEGQEQPPSGADPYSGYGSPQNPYGAPPQNPYGTPLRRILMLHNRRKTPMPHPNNTVLHLISKVATVMDMLHHSKRLDQSVKLFRNCQINILEYSPNHHG